jgi:polyisoprenoid-binding protein YceI
MNKLALILLMAVSPTPWAAESFVLDPEHTFPSFEIRHQNVSWMRGKFNRSAGKVVLDAQNPGGNLIEVVVDASSGDTGHDELTASCSAPTSSIPRAFPKSASSPAT